VASPQRGGRGRLRTNLDSNEEALEVIISAIEKAGYKVGKDIYLGLDVASSEFYKDGHYELESEKRTFTSTQFSKYLADLAGKYPSSPLKTG